MDGLVVVVVVIFLVAGLGAFVGNGRARPANVVVLKLIF